jgi:hypothetical protein
MYSVGINQCLRSTILKSSSFVPVREGKASPQQLSHYLSIANALEFWVRREGSRVRTDGFRASAKLVIDDAVVETTVMYHYPIACDCRCTADHSQDHHGEWSGVNR